jgi:hypothetical protein
MRRRSALLTCVLLVLAPGVASAGVHVTKQDRIATRAYLEADYAYEQAAVEHVAASKEDVEALAGRLEHECPGVVEGAPELGSVLSGESPRQSWRQKGEQGRQFRQLEDVEREISLALAQARAKPYREAGLSFADIVKSLQWSDGGTTAARRAAAAVLAWELRARPPRVCADLRHWASSNYTSLSAATRTLAIESDRVDGPWLVFAFLLQPAYAPLTSFEDSRDRALARKTARLKAKREREVAIGRVEKQLKGSVGLLKEEQARLLKQREVEAQRQREEPESREEREEHEREEREREEQAKGWVLIARGRTAAGGAYKVEVERRRPDVKHGGHPCVEFSVTESIKEAGGGAYFCASRSRPRAPTVACKSGLLTIEAQTVAGARSVTLTLSDGRQITSAVVVVPPRLGGPLGYYRQALWGPSPVPVGLVERSAHGQVLRRLTLPRRTGCKRPLSAAELFGSLRVVAREQAPEGPSFFVIAGREPARAGARSPALPHRRSSKRDADIQLFVLEFGSLFSREGYASRAAPSPSHPFAGQVATGCQPHEHAILYGLLGEPRDQVLARTSGGLTPLRHVRLPARLHTRDVLAYAVLPSVPSEVVVRSPTGKTLKRTSVRGKRYLTARAKHAKEVCEGEAEPPL